MELEFASDPSQPTWEPPRILKSFQLDDCRTGTVQNYTSRITARAQALDRAQNQLNQLCSSPRSRSDLEEFLATWRDPVHPSRVQLNALAWFQAGGPLAMAIRNGHEDAVRILLAHGLKPEQPDIWAALEVLENTNNKAALNMLLHGGWGIDRPVNENATSILGCLVRDQDLVEWCLSLGASPNVAGPMGKTAMHQASALGSLETLKLLVNHGGVIAGTDVVAHAALAYCGGAEDRLEVIYHLLQNGASIDAYHMGHSGQWSSPTNSLFLTYGRQNALHFAISSGNKELVEMLLSRGADPSLEMYSLRTELRPKKPRELALLLGHEDIAKLL